MYHRGHRGHRGIAPLVEYGAASVAVLPKSLADVRSSAHQALSTPCVLRAPCGSKQLQCSVSSGPRLVIAVSLDEPDTIYGGVAAAPLFQQIARYAIQRLGIPSAAPVALPPHAQKLP